MGEVTSHSMGITELLRLLAASARAAGLDKRGGNCMANAWFGLRLVSESGDRTGHTAAAASNDDDEAIGGEEIAGI